VYRLRHLWLGGRWCDGGANHGWVASGGTGGGVGGGGGPPGTQLLLPLFEYFTAPQFKHLLKIILK